MHDLQRALQEQLRAWNALDWSIAALLAASTCAALLKGLIISLVSLLGVCAGVSLAFLYTPWIAPMLLGWVGSPRMAKAVTFLLIFAVVYFCVTLLGRLLHGVCHAVGLGLFNRTAGALFGFARGVLLLAVVVQQVAPYLQHSVEWQGSLLLPYLLQASHGISSVVPQTWKGRLYLSQ